MRAQLSGSTPKLYAIVIIALFLVLQFGVPVVQLAQDGSQRWGWQMFSRAPDIGEVGAVDGDGALRAIDLQQHLIAHRFELTVNDSLVNQLCERNPDAAGIRIQHSVRKQVQEFPCSEY